MYIHQGSKRKITDRKRGRRLKAKHRVKQRRRVNGMHSRKQGMRLRKARAARKGK